MVLLEPFVGVVGATEAIGGVVVPFEELVLLSVPESMSATASGTSSGMVRLTQENVMVG